MKRKNLWKKALAVALSATLMLGVPTGAVFAENETENEVLVEAEATETEESEEVETEVAETEIAETEESEEVETEAAETESVETEESEEVETEVTETEIIETEESEEVETEITETTEEIEVTDQQKTANGFTNLQCGESVYATLSNGVLTISGNGKMWDADTDRDSVFFQYANSIREVVVTDGVTSVGKYAFSAVMTSGKIEKLTLADSVETIGYGAFRYQKNIRTLNCPKNLTTIETDAFYYCSALQTVSLNDSLETIEAEAFYLSGLKEVVVPEYCEYMDSTFGYGVILHQKTTVTLNANGGTVNGAQTATLIQYEKETYGNPSKLPTPVRDGYDFLGWYDYTDGAEGNNVASSGETVKYHAYLMAKWCNHSNKTVKNAKNATYEEEGYTGDTYCADCGKVLAYGKTIERKKLAAPKMSGVTNVKNGLKIKWKKSKDAKGYYVYRKQDGKYKKIATVKNGTSYVDESVKKSTGKKYSYKVCAFYGKATSNLTGAESQVRVANADISSLKSASKKTMTVNWNKVSKCGGYQIQYSKDKNFKKNVTTKNIKKQSQSSVKISKLSSGKKYYVRVRSYKVVNDKKYYSAWSSTKNVKVK